MPICSYFVLINRCWRLAMVARRNSGFTVVELLVVIAIIGVLVALLLPAVQMARESARQTQCRNNLRQCGMAIANYDTAKGNLPASRTADLAGTGKVLNWVVPVLAELEQGPLLTEIRTGKIPQPTLIPILICPSLTRDASESPPAGIAPGYPLSYVVNGGRQNRADNFDWIENGVFVDKSQTPTAPPRWVDKHSLADIAKYDGTSNTLMLSENPSVPSWLEAPVIPAAIGSAMGEQFSQMLWFPEDPSTFAGFIGLNQDLNVAATQFSTKVRYARPGSHHPGGFNVTMCDGSVQFMSDTTDYRIYAVLMTSRGERANAPANTTFAGPLPDPTWQSPSAPDYPGTQF
jgi:prepilin-type N-terminal cleavage/methylation domain-containing protein/prepilin-type processing-associated H-X9-DG protein